MSHTKGRSASLETVREVYCILHSRSLTYSANCLQSLLRHSVDPITLTLVVDNRQEKEQFQAETANWRFAQKHVIHLREIDEIEELASQEWNGLFNLSKFQRGHPCWRKITDALVLAKGRECIIVDPDVLFLRDFSFPRLAAPGVHLMWQPRNCLYPFDAVSAVFDAGYPLADYVDIGIAVVRLDMDWPWLDRLLGNLDLAKFRPFMHVEPIVWSAMAMHFGGGYLDPVVWTCFYETWSQRILRVFGRRNLDTINHLDLSRSCALHLGGPIKNHLSEIQECTNRVVPLTKPVTSTQTPKPTLLDGTQFPLKEYTPTMLARKRWAVQILKCVGLKAG